MKINSLCIKITAICAAAAGALFNLSCELPKGFDVKSSDFRANVDVGEYLFDMKGEGSESSFSLADLHPDNLQKKMFQDGGGEIYNGIEGGKRIFANDIDAKKQQTYLIHFAPDFDAISVGQIEEEMMNSLKSSLDEGLKAIPIPSLMDDDGYLEQPPGAQAFSIPVHLNTGESEDGSPRVKSVSGLRYDVVLTFKKLPKVNGTGAEINKNNKSQFADWVKFSDNGNTPVGGTEVVLADNYAETRTVVWRSGKINLNDADSDNVTLATIALDLKPKMTLQNGIPLTRGVQYKIALAIYDFDDIKMALTQENNMGDTSELVGITQMLKGLEFDKAYMYMFTNLEASNVTIKAVKKGKQSKELYTGAMTTADFNKDAFYVEENAGASTITASTSTPIDLVGKGLLKKESGAYNLVFKIDDDITITKEMRSTGMKFEIAMLLPLSFSIIQTEGSEDTIEAVTVLIDNNESTYYKLKVDGLDDMLNIDNGKIDLKNMISQLDTKPVEVKFNQAWATLTIKNQILPEALVIGIDNGIKIRDKTIYDQVIPMRDGARPSVTSRLTIKEKQDGSLPIPKPALLIKPDEGNNSATLRIPPITAAAEESNVSVDIAAEISMQIKYSGDF
jgi:hypothetical protein